MAPLKQSPPSLLLPNEIIPATLRRSPISIAGKTPISELPNEILEDIFKFAAFNDAQPHNYLKEICIPIALVCRRWTCVVERLLFYILKGNLGDDDYPDEIFTKLLFRFAKKPYRYNYVRLFRVYISSQDTSLDSIDDVLDAVWSCRNIHSLCLTCDLDEATSPILEPVKTLRLRYLSIQALYHGVPINVVSKYFNMPTLEELSLARYGWADDDRLMIEEYDEDTIGLTDWEVEKLRLPKFEHLGGVKKLHLLYPWTNPLVTKYLLSWPTRLEEVNMFDLSELERCVIRYTSATVARLLGGHRDWLKKLWIGWSCAEETEIADFSGFTQLEHLYISAYSVVKFPVSEVCPRLLAPNLRCLVLEFSSYKSGRKVSELFGEEEFVWIEEFLCHMSSKYPHARLEEICINFGDRDDVKEFWEGLHDTCPYHYLAAAIRVAHEHGVELMYTQPLCWEVPWELITRQIPPRFGEV